MDVSTHLKSISRLVPITSRPVVSRLSTMNPSGWGGSFCKTFRSLSSSWQPHLLPNIHTLIWQLLGWFGVSEVETKARPTSFGWTPQFSNSAIDILTSPSAPGVHVNWSFHCIKGTLVVCQLLGSLLQLMAGATYLWQYMKGVTL